ncbi:TolC family protein [Salinimicrobium sp. 3283s]|uniref:TolC family protein n=1 Tax=unclassified Salinimicrobium TaxID=2643747 RepID=UPI0031EC0CB4
MKKNIINIGALIMFFLALWTNNSHAQEEEIGIGYLDKYLVLAAENNPQIRSLYKEYLAALEKVVQEGTLPDPQISFGYFIQPVETRVGAQQATASFSQMFPWFGTLDAQERVAAERAQARLQLFEDAKLELFRDVKITYTELYYLEMAIQVTEENLALLSSFKSIAEVQFESGKTGFSSVLQVELEEEELESRLAYLKDSRIPLLTEFEELLNEELQEPLGFPDSLWEEQLLNEKSILLEMILAENPRLEQLEHQARSFEEQLTVAKKMGLPSFTLGGTYTNIASRTDLDPAMALPDNGQDAFIFPQVGIRVPLYRNKYKAMRQEAILQQEAVQLKKENLENELETKLEQLYRDYVDAVRNVELYNRLTTIAKQSLELYQTELSTGRNNVLEIIRMERQLLNYGLELARAKTERNNNVYRINYLIGEGYE